MPTVMLDEHGIGLIVSWPTDIFYSNQANGYSCWHPRHEGFYLPLATSNGRIDHVATSHGEVTDYWTRVYAGEVSYRYMTEADATFLDGFLARTVSPFFITVDHERLAESMEAWVYVNLALRPDKDFTRGFDTYAPPSHGVFVWPNSD